MSPLPVGLLCAALLAGSVALSNPFAIAACAAAAGALLWASPPPRAMYVWFAATSALLVFLVNPFVSVQGLTPIWSGPHIPLLDTEITQEELVFGIAAGLRLIGSAMAVAAFVRLADGDRVLAALARVAPRSAMIAALASRLLPTLEQDATGLAMASRSRAAQLHRRRPAAALAAPLVGLSLERSLMLAEAMEARGYGGAVRTRTPQPGLNAPERVLTAIGIVTCAVVATAIPLDDYRYYDLLGDPFTTVGLATAALVGAGRSRRRRRRCAGRGGRDEPRAAHAGRALPVPGRRQARPGRRQPGRRAGRAGAGAGRVRQRQVDPAAGGTGPGAELPRRRAGGARGERGPGHA